MYMPLSDIFKVSEYSKILISEQGSLQSELTGLFLALSGPLGGLHTTVSVICPRTIRAGRYKRDKKKMIMKNGFNKKCLMFDKLFFFFFKNIQRGFELLSYLSINIHHFGTVNFLFGVAENCLGGQKCLYLELTC